jgi:hypothetical protein
MCVDMTLNKCILCKTWHYFNAECPDFYTIYDDGFVSKLGTQLRAYSFEEAAKNYVLQFIEQNGANWKDRPIIIEDKMGNRRIVILCK